MTSPGHRIFVSHSHIDNEFGKRLAQDLGQVLKDESAVFYDVLGDVLDGLHGGDTWWDKIVEELTARDVFLLVLSPDAMNSPWIRREINIALNKNKFILPILHRSCTIRPDLETIQIISFLAPKSYEAAFLEVLIALDHLKEPSSVPSKIKERWVDIGNDLYSRGRIHYVEALAAYDQAIHLVPNDARAYSAKGNTLDGLKRYEEALAAYEHAIRLDPNDACVYNNKGVALDSLKRYKEANSVYDQAIRLDPNDARAYFGKGKTLERLGKIQEALQTHLKTWHLITITRNETQEKTR
jgi:tetratricopeptide (TPR) repeat protein